MNSEHPDSVPPENANDIRLVPLRPRVGAEPDIRPCPDPSPREHRRNIQVGDIPYPVMFESIWHISPAGGNLVRVEQEIHTPMRGIKIRVLLEQGEFWDLFNAAKPKPVVAKVCGISIRDLPVETDSNGNQKLGNGDILDAGSPPGLAVSLDDGEISNTGFAVVLESGEHFLSLDSAITDLDQSARDSYAETLRNVPEGDRLEIFGEKMERHHAENMAAHAKSHRAFGWLLFGLGHLWHMVGQQFTSLSANMATAGDVQGLGRKIDAHDVKSMVAHDKTHKKTINILTRVQDIWGHMFGWFAPGANKVTLEKKRSWQEGDRTNAIRQFRKILAHESKPSDNEAIKRLQVWWDNDPVQRMVEFPSRGTAQKWCKEAKIVHSKNH